MKKEIKTYEIQCDCCETTLDKKGAYSNNSLNQSNFVSIGKIDLCFICAGKIFDMNLTEKISEETLKEWVYSARKKLSLEPLVDDIEYPNIFKKYYVHKDIGPKYYIITYNTN